jgi:hypothetical protein
MKNPINMVWLVAAGVAAAAALSVTTAAGFTETYADPDDLRAKGDQFMAHLRARHASDPRAARALRAFKGVRVTNMPGIMSFSRSTGILKVNPARVRDDPAHAAATLLHELAHTTPEKHNADWRQTFLFFADVATRELGWAVRLACAHCKYYGVCSQESCPRCAFDACPPGQSTWALKNCRSRKTCEADTGTPPPVV